MGKEYFFSVSRRSDVLRGPTRLLFHGYGLHFSQGKAQLPTIPSWISQPQFFYYYHFYFTNIPSLLVEIPKFERNMKNSASINAESRLVVLDVFNI